MKRRIINVLKEKYGPEIKLKKLESKNNQVYLLETKNEEKKVIKIDTKNEDESWTIQKELYLYELLKKEKIPSPKIELIDDNKFPMFYVMEYLGGENLKENPKSTLLIELGKLFAKIHKIKFNEQGIIFHDGIEKYNLKEHKLKNFENHLKKLGDNNQLNKDIGKEMDWVRNNFFGSDRKVLCHNDFGPWQAIVGDEYIKGIIDWEWAESSEPSLDIAKTEVLMEIITPNRFMYLRKGYEKISSLKEYDEVKLPYMIVECIGFMYYFKDNKKMFESGRKLLNKLFEEIKRKG